MCIRDSNGGGHRRPRGILPSAKLGVISEGVAANAPVGGKNHFFNGLLVREEERALLQKYTTKIPSRREIEKMETEEAAAASLGDTMILVDGKDNEARTIPPLRTRRRLD